jgi:predicted DNA-binding transcriptional regulator AlpA
MPKAKSTTAAPAPVGRRLMTRREAAEFLTVSQATLSRWAADRTGPPFIKLHDGGCGSIRYPSDLLAEFVQSRITMPKS